MKALVNIFLFLLVLLNSAIAQVILPLGMGQKNSLNITCSDKDKLWVISDEAQKFVINKWDGSFWIPYMDIPENFLSTLAATHSLRTAKAIYYHKGIIHVAFANNQTGQILLLKNSGRNWETINTDKITVEGTMTFIAADDTLLLCGKLLVDQLPKSILKINKTDCEVYAGTWANQTISSEFKDFEYSGNRIWAIGIFSSITDEKHFAILENKIWKSVDNPPYTNGFDAFGKYNNGLVVAGYDFDGQKSISLQNSADPTKWNEISNGLTGWDIISISDFLQAGINLWAAGKFYNKAKNQLASLAFWNGSAWSIPQFDYIGDKVKLNGTSEVLISGDFYDHQGLVLNKAGKLTFGTALIAGKVFYDLNQNCSQDFGENPIQGVIIRLIPEDIYIISDFNGRYYFPVDIKISVHAIELQTPLYHSATCNNFKSVKHVDELTIADIDFGIIPTSGHTDAAVSVQDYTGWRARQGFTEQYKICVTNKGTQKTETSRLVFTSDNRITNWVFSETPVTINNNTSEWNIKTLAIGERYCINAKAEIPVQITLGDKLQFDAKIIANADENAADNLTVLQQNVVAAIDPNDKTTKQGYIIAPTITTLDYKIRFQNTGTDTAYNIIVKDTIDANLVINPMGAGLSSSFKDYDIAPNTWWIAADGKYRYYYAFRLKGIMLPDSNTNEAESHGFINFTLNIKPTLALGTLIKNRAFIYFDYQEPILTNTVKNLVSLGGGIKNIMAKDKLNIYPNPAAEHLYISNPMRSVVSVSVINSLGQVVLSKKISAGSQLIIETTTLVKGLYLIKAEGFAACKVLVN